MSAVEMLTPVADIGGPAQPLLHVRGLTKHFVRGGGLLAKGAVVPEHSHESEQITYILEGALLFEIDGKEILVGKGQVLRIPSWKPHKATALEDTLDLDIFSPIREDWLKKDDAYLRRG